MTPGALVDAYHAQLNGARHWLSYHLAPGEVTSFGSSFLEALTNCEAHLPGAGVRLIEEVAAIRYTPKIEDATGWRNGFEQLVQKMAEILVAHVVLTAKWPAGTSFEIEPANPVTGKKVDLVVNTPEHQWLFEVKCPAFIDYQDNRDRNPTQLPSRSPLRDAVELQNGGVTLPRDNVFKDFLRSAESKFVDFSDQPQTGILVVLWDSYMFEAASALCHNEVGLLTANSWYKEDGVRVPFDAVDGVIVLNHLEVFKADLQEQARQRQTDTFRIGGDGEPPNIWHPNFGRDELDGHVARIFNALPQDAVSMAADYRPQEFVMWFDPLAEARRHRKLQRRTALLNSTSPVSIAAGDDG